jgi:protocatechuate 3,4-dioxygenase beta subunit
VTFSRRVLPALTITPLLVSVLAVTTAAPATSASSATSASPRVRAAAAVTADESRTWEDTYYSTPPSLTDIETETRPAAPQRRAKPKPPPTKGFVAGRVMGPGGKPVKNALVYGVRFSDLGRGIDFSEEARVVARTTAAGFFRLKQLTERYLVRICPAEPDAVECSTDNVVKNFQSSYVGPEGTTVSWLRQTSMFVPAPRSRSIGTVTVKSSAALAGTFKGAENELVYLLRGDDSIADRTITDEKGRYRFEVAGGTYRLEVDKDPGLRTPDTVPGFRSGKLKLKPGQIKHLSFRTRHAGVVRGTVTSGGNPVADVFLAILDKDDDFAAGVVTDANGRYTVTSLKPGDYTIRTSVGFSDYISQTKAVTLEQKAAKAVDFALDPGAKVTFSATGAISAELRNQAGRVMKAYQGVPAEEPGGLVEFKGLPPETYKLYVRKAAFPFASPTETNFPWAQAQVLIAPAVTEVALGPVPLSQPTLTLTGKLTKGSQVKMTAIPQDLWLREAYENGDQVTPMALVWTERAKKSGAYASYGLVPGTYSVLQTTSYRDRGEKGVTTGGNVATKKHLVTVSPTALTASFKAPDGLVVKGRMEYANGNPVIAPVGLRVYDAGDFSWLMPTVSGPQKFGKPFRVERLHKGDAVARLLDLDELYEEHPDVLIPDTLVSSARLAETGTPYWFVGRAEKLKLRKGEVVDLGVITVLLRGLEGGS